MTERDLNEFLDSMRVYDGREPYCYECGEPLALDDCGNICKWCIEGKVIEKRHKLELA